MSRCTHKLGESKAIEHFRPQLFKNIDKAQESLKLDLFWPVSFKERNQIANDYAQATSVKGEETPVDDDVSDDGFFTQQYFPYNGLSPLCAFRDLRVLHIGGMMQTYQPMIWQVVWSNPHLKVLQLEMALPPLFNKDSTRPNRIIDSNWIVFPSMSPRNSLSSTNLPSIPEEDEMEDLNEYAYLGDMGTGRLHPTYGSGEYLDDTAIKNGLLAANANDALSNSYRRFLSIQKLTLMNFVVDGIAFNNWFDADVLKSITFRGSCIDAGFYLHHTMKHKVELHVPSPGYTPIGLAERVPASELTPASLYGALPTTGPLQLLTLKAGKPTNRVDVGSMGKAELVRPARPSSLFSFGSANKFRLVRDAVMERLGRGKENKSTNNLEASSETLVAAAARSGAGSRASCFGSMADLSLEDLPAMLAEREGERVEED